MADPFIGEIRAFGFGFVPRGWALCNGQMLSPRQYSQLFLVIGKKFGGDGERTFALPNLAGGAAVGSGSAPGFTKVEVGQQLGANRVALTVENLPAHSHAVTGATAIGARNHQEPGEDRYLSRLLDESADPVVVAAWLPKDAEPGTTLSPASVSIAPGGSAAHENRQPFLAVNYCMAIEGEMPTY